MKKIPDNAKMVFNGILHDVYQWDQLLFDGSTATFEAIRKRDSVTVVAITDGKIIINNEEQPMRPPFVAFPGGIIEDSGNILENAKRELLEETGYASDDWQEWFVSDPLNHAKIEWNNNVFIARNCKKVGEQKLDPGEKISTHLISFDEFLELRHNPASRNKDFFPLLKKVAHSDEEKQKLRELFGMVQY